MFRRSLPEVLRNRKFEASSTKNLTNDIKNILDRNGFEFYDKREDGTLVEEFYINNDSWMTVFLSADSKTNNSVYVTISSPQNDSVNLEIKNTKDLKKFEFELF